MALSFDYIVVGAGSAGCTIANRLVMARKSVLLLEAGPKDSTPFIHIPAMFYRVVGSHGTWKYKTEPQPGYGGRTAVPPQGRTVGGGSSVNAMVYIRGQHEDYDDWETAGCRGWGWPDVLPFFKLSEGNQRLNDEFHGTEGPLKVSDPRHRHVLCEAFVDAGVQAGLPRNDDFNGRSQLGVGFFQTTTFNGRRMSAARAYISSIRKSRLLRLETDAHVLGLLTENGAATGVKFRMKNGEECEAIVRDEVILSVGTFGSPSMLELSGFGSAAHLSSLGVKVLRDIPEVGRNLRDHVNANVIAKLSQPVGVVRTNNGLMALKHLASYALFRSGILASNVLECGGFVDTAGTGRPDIQFHVLPGYGSDTGSVKAEGLHGISIVTCVLRPKSHGSTNIRSANPMEPPRIDTRVLSDPDDMATLKRGLRVARKILRAPALAQYVEKELAPSTSDDVSDAELERYVKASGKTIYHPVGTCRMGADAQSVVDLKLRVRGVNRLRVADASIMPMLISGNTNATSIMIGERCASFILNGQ